MKENLGRGGGGGGRGSARGEGGVGGAYATVVVIDSILC